LRLLKIGATKWRNLEINGSRQLRPQCQQEWQRLLELHVGERLTLGADMP